MSDPAGNPFVPEPVNTPPEAPRPNVMTPKEVTFTVPSCVVPLSVTAQRELDDVEFGMSAAGNPVTVSDVALLVAD